MALQTLQGQLAGHPLPANIGAGESMPWGQGGGMSVDQPALPPAVQAAVGRGEMNPVDARARVTQNRPGFGGRQTPGIVPGRGPMAKPATRPVGGANPQPPDARPGGGGMGTGAMPPDIRPGGSVPTAPRPMIAQEPTQGGTAPGPQAMRPEEQPWTPPGGSGGASPMSPMNGGGLQSAPPLLPNGGAMHPVIPDESGGAGPLLPNGQPMGGQNPAYKNQMMGAMRSMFQ